MVKKSFEFEPRYSDIEQRLEERKKRIKTLCFKICSKCGETKSVYRFPIDKRNTDGRISICKACRSQESLRYYYQNRAERLVQIKEYRENHQEQRSAYHKNYQEENRELLKKLAHKWYKKNKKQIKKRNLKYYQENKEACQIRRRLWIENNKEKIKKYNREYKRKRRLKNKKAVIRKGKNKLA